MLWFHLLTLIAYVPMLFVLWAIFASVLGGWGGAVALAALIWLAARYGD